ncbi:MAG: IS1634 family transposase [Verrucomicrobiia bacterium]
MPSLTRKLIHGRPYYYARWCQRVDGRPKIVKTLYLSSLDNIVQAVETSQLPLPPGEAEVVHFGDVVALYDQAEHLGVVELIDAQIPKRHQGLSVGQYLLLAAINRAAHPTSKAKLAQWHRQTVLPRLLPASADELTSQAFWNHMDRVRQEDIEAIERNLARRLLRDLKLDLRMLVYDGTNFFTYINTCTPATLPARGHNKQKRGDLRQVNLGMLVSTDFHVPLLHRVYTGNVTDATAFQSISEELARHYQQLAEGCEHITLIFDKGNNSAEAFESVNDSVFHFVGSLVPTQHPELLSIPLEQFRPLPGARFEGVSVYRTRKIVFGQERTILITFNESLLEGQLQGITAHLEKARRRLSDLQDSLRRHRQGRVKGGRAPKIESVRKQVDQILSGQFLKQLLHCDVDAGQVPSLRFRSDISALARLVDTQLGKTLLFTDNDDWSDQEIVSGYRAQYHIESAFRDMKNPHFLGWSPMFHWTDSKIRVHAFYCVLALTLVSLLQRTLHSKGIDLSLTRMMELLGAIQEVLVIYPRQPGQHKPRTAVCLSHRDEEQQRLCEALALERYEAR